MSTSESNLMDALNCSNNSLKSSSSKSSTGTIDSQATLTASSTMWMSSNNTDFKSMDFEIEQIWI